MESYTLGAEFCFASWMTKLQLATNSELPESNTEAILLLSLTLSGKQPISGGQSYSYNWGIYVPRASNKISPMLILG